MKKYFALGALFLLGTLAVASGTRFWDFDIWRSADHTKNWTPPAATDTLVGRVSVDTLQTKTFSDAIIGTQIVTPGNPGAGLDKLYFKSDDKLYRLNSAGVENVVGGGGSLDYTPNTQVGTYYALAPTDAYGNGNFPLLTMSNAATQQVLVPNHAITPFATGARIAIHQLGVADVQIIPDTSVTLNSPDGTIMSAQYSHAELVQTAPDVWTVNGNHLQPLIVATCSSCSITTSGKFKIATFNVSDTLVITKGSGQIASWIVAQGGGGGAGYAGGGGGGGTLYTSLASAATYGAGSYTVTVGSSAGVGGSQGGATNSTNGSDSVFDPTGTNVRASGGGHGGDGFGLTNGAGGNGGCGGGGSGYAPSGGFSGGTGSQGFAGGTGNATPYGGGGGGGNAVGHNGAGNDGVGGAGITCPNATMCGANVYAGGGGAAVATSGQAAAGGTGGGGAGVAHLGSGATGVSGTANTGGGGGGGSDNITGGVGGAGGSGQIVLMWQYQ